MKKLSKISLGQLYKNDMAAREMNMLRGGKNCGCNCYESLISKHAAFDANAHVGFVENGSTICSWSAGGDATVYGGSTVPNNLL